MDPILFDIPDEILTPRLRLRIPRAGDGPTVAAAVLASRAEVAPWMVWLTAEYGVSDAELWARRCHAKFILREQITFVMLERETGEVVGGSGPHTVNWKLGTCEIGYWVRSDRVGRGLMSEALNAICDMLFSATQLRRIEVRCDERNLRSAAVAERCGFAYEGTLRSDALDAQNHPRSTKIYSRIRPSPVCDPVPDAVQSAG